MKNIIIIILSAIIILLLFKPDVEIKKETPIIKVYDSLQITNIIDTSYYRDTLPPIQDTIKIVKEYFKTTKFKPQIKTNTFDVKLDFDISENSLKSFNYTVDYYEHRHTISLNRAINKSYYLVQYSYKPRFNFTKINLRLNSGLILSDHNLTPIVGIGISF